MKRSGFKSKPVTDYKCANKCGKNAVKLVGNKKVCSKECAGIIALKALDRIRAKRKTEQKKTDRKRLQELNDTVPSWTKKVQKVFNEFVRLRDKDKPCISCGNENIKHSNVGGLWDCGHYRTVGSSPELRFDELNAHKQCKYCNNYLSGNVVEYRKNLMKRIGPEKLELVEGPHEPKRYRVEDLKELYKFYFDKCKELKNANN